MFYKNKLCCLHFDVEISKSNFYGKEFENSLDYLPMYILCSI